MGTKSPASLSPASAGMPGCLRHHRLVILRMSDVPLPDAKLRTKI